ncbi:YslB family protein [Paucisalibacillus sp. EB02]|uniref:YslB family protein n=1 Tax=Paucisalibacillus sp. EB02 TaxID=1347087 RepID=UPI0004BC5FED|nr:YslB family protein [Paucisalibacillus sp. EB02]
MKTNKETLPIELLDQIQSSGAGYDLLRYVSLPDIFGSESEALLYFMGRSLARKFEINALSDIIYFFEKIGWGRLELFKEKSNQLEFHLLSDAVVQRLAMPVDVEFRLEAGFLAEAISMLKGAECECIEEVRKKIHQVEFTIIFVE